LFPVHITLTNYMEARSDCGHKSILWPSNSTGKLMKLVHRAEILTENLCKYSNCAKKWRRRVQSLMYSPGSPSSPVRYLHLQRRYLLGKNRISDTVTIKLKQRAGIQINVNHYSFLVPTLCNQTVFTIYKTKVVY